MNDSELVVWLKTVATLQAAAIYRGEKQGAARLRECAQAAAHLAQFHGTVPQSPSPSPSPAAGSPPAPSDSPDSPLQAAADILWPSQPATPIKPVAEMTADKAAE